MAQWDRAALSDVLDQRLTLEEMQDAAFDLGYEDAEGRTKSQLVRALLEYLDDRQQLDRLIDWLKKRRPDIDTTPFAVTSAPTPTPQPHGEPRPAAPTLTSRPIGIALVAALALVFAGGLWALLGARVGPTPAPTSPPTSVPIVLAPTTAPTVTPMPPTPGPTSIPSPTLIVATPTAVRLGAAQDTVKVHLSLSRVWIVGVDPRPQPIAEARVEGSGDKIGQIVSEAYHQLNPVFHAPTPAPLDVKVQVASDGSVSVTPAHVQVVAYALTNQNSPAQISPPPEALAHVSPADARPQYLELLAEGYGPGHIDLPNPFTLPFSGETTLKAPSRPGVALAKPMDISITPSTRQYGPALLATLTELAAMDVGSESVVPPSEFQRRLDRLAADIAKVQNSPGVKTSLRANLGVSYLIEAEFSVSPVP